MKISVIILNFISAIIIVILDYFDLNIILFSYRWFLRFVLVVILCISFGACLYTEFHEPKGKIIKFRNFTSLIGGNPESIYAHNEPTYIRVLKNDNGDKIGVIFLEEKDCELNVQKNQDGLFRRLSLKFSDKEEDNVVFDNLPKCN